MDFYVLRLRIAQIFACAELRQPPQMQPHHTIPQVRMPYGGSPSLVHQAAGTSYDPDTPLYHIPYIESPIRQPASSQPATLCVPDTLGCVKRSAITFSEIQV